MSETERGGPALKPEASDQAPHYWVCALPFLVTAARFRNSFVFDDVFVIRSDFIFDPANLPRALVNRTMIASSLDKAVGRPGMDTYRPLSVASFFWDAALSGRTPWSFHLSNALMHCAVCALLLALLARLFPALASRYRTCLVAWFGLAPWLSEAHVWINGRSDLLLAIGFLAALLLMRRALIEGRLALGVGAGAALFAALLSKEIAVVLLPFVAAVPTPGSARLRERVRFGWPLLPVLGVYLALRSYSLSGLRSYSDASQLALAAKQVPLVLLDGLRYLLAPTPYFLRSMRDDYAALSPWLVVGAWLVLLSGLALLLLWLRRAYTFVWGSALALVSLAPAAMISTALWPGFGRYLYVPALGVSIALGAALDSFLRQRAAPPRALWPAFVGYVAVCGVMLLDATLSFADEESLYGRAIEQRPQQAWTYGFAGMSLKREQHCDKAIPFLNRAATMDADESRYSLRLGQCLLELGALEPAQRVAEAGRARFSGTRFEAGFSLLLARTLPSSRGEEQRALLRRCLEVDAERSDCRMLLELAERRDRGGQPPSPWD